VSAASFVEVGHVLEEAVERAAFPASFRRLLRVPLQQPGKVLAGAKRPLWPATVLAACTAARGATAIGIQVAAAVELFMAALDVLDEIEDGDYSPTTEAGGPGQALNASTALLLLAQNILCRLDQAGLPADRVALFVHALTEAGIEATTGQHRDLAATGNSLASTEVALTIARLKAGALAGGACRLGALAGTTDESLLTLYHDWGQHFGTGAQLANDLHDAEDREHKSDAERGKDTLPLLYARSLQQPQEVIGSVAASGALHFTWVILELERQECARILEQLITLGQQTSELRALLGRVE